MESNEGDLMKKNAVISDDGLYRYWLFREWGSGPQISWVMLNPSTADASIDDPTIKRCIQFSRDWGYGALHVMNLFAIRSTDPSILKTISKHEAFGPSNDWYLIEAGRNVEKVVCAWGNPGGSMAPAILKSSGGIWHLGLTKSGCPKHPLYLPKTTELVRWWV